jgi:hypothetical protein
MDFKGSAVDPKWFFDIFVTIRARFEKSPFLLQKIKNMIIKMFKSIAFLEVKGIRQRETGVNKTAFRLC